MDPRDVFSKKLQEIGISKFKADGISLEAGSSQAIVNKESLREANIPEELIEEATEILFKFYSGELYFLYCEEFEDEW